MEHFDDLGFLVQETFRINGLSKLAPSGPGVLYNLQSSSLVFSLRALAVSDVDIMVTDILKAPEDYPSLRLLENEGDPAERLKWFSTGSQGEAEYVCARVAHRRFPRREEDLCNLSDPGFGWWLEEIPGGFVIHGKRNSLHPNLRSLGPLADPNLFQRHWQDLSEVMSGLPVPLEWMIGNARFQLSSVESPWLTQELMKVFLNGEVSEELRELFIILGRKYAKPAQLEASWYFLKEAAAMRRFWVALEAHFS